MTNLQTHQSDTTGRSGLFCFIGADPATSWLQGVGLDQDGYVLTDVALGPDQPGEAWASLGRQPLPFETSERPRGQWPAGRARQCTGQAV